ncbi:SDR family oxidoreductase [Kordiimonas marina]|uniref:SDR family oxidoreductase n=1 Tax=Kordiimonas marina TaxID=2872312 RepID=UPI001FF417F7|nr:SDR family oxidoreductase [Kordiimonas marina]MCJ9429909.1 SDR family oxidoreductase [Kordiimonas marina]
MTDFRPHLLVFGPGYSARAVMTHALDAGWTVSATVRQPEKAKALEAIGVTPVEITDQASFEDAMRGLPFVSHTLTSVAPNESGDPILEIAGSWLEQQKTLQWAGYLSSTNVYGDHGGAWVDEDTPPSPSLERGKRRVAAEQAWAEMAGTLGASLHIFRLAGIYGPGRNAVRSLMDGRARRIVKEGQLFSRIHVADIGGAVWRAMTSSHASDIFNLADDMPAPPQDVITEAARLIGMAPPPTEDFETAEMSPMARSFYAESKRVRNDRVKTRLGYSLKYPDYRTALKELAAYEQKIG